MFLLCVPEAVAEPVSNSVSVNPLKGVDSDTCGLTIEFPCRTIQYALDNRKANALSLSPSVFNESSVIISDIPKLIINGAIGTVFDCSLRTDTTGLSDPAFRVSNATVVISRLTFQNCTNLRVAGGLGGALSASNSNININDCIFLKNVAQVGGAIGAEFSKLVVVSSVFQNNMATCPNPNFTSMSQVCSAWGGAIGFVEAQKMEVVGCTFISNMVNLVFDGVTNPTSTSVGGGGCVSVMYNGNVSESQIAVDGNTFERCLVKMFGLNSSSSAGIQFGNTYGGAVSVYYGLSAFFSVDVLNVATLFINNRCFNSGITSSVGVAGNAYGGCLSVYAGAWKINTGSYASVNSVDVSRMRVNVSSNTIVNCSAVMTSSSWSSTGNVYGGAISVYVGHFVSGKGSSSVSGNTIVTDSVYILKSNSLISCNSSSITLGTLDGGIGSFGANVYGGGVSLVIGSYSLSFDDSASETASGSSNSTVLGGTIVSNTSYDITDNSLVRCVVSSAASGLVKSGADKSQGANVYGGGLSLTVGAYSYSFSTGQSSSSSSVSANTRVSNSSYYLARNVLTGCQVLSFTESLELQGGRSIGANAHGGGISLAIGAYSYSYSFHISSSSVFGTTVSGSSYLISDNRFTGCSASSLTLKNESSYSDDDVVNRVSDGSFGTNVYGGAISLMVGAYSHSFGFSIFSDSLIYGEISVSDVSLLVTGNSLINCFASCKTSGGGGSFGGNSYGGGVSVMVGAYSFSLSRSSRSSSSVSGLTVVGHTNYTMSTNAFTGCYATSTTGRSVREGFGSYGVSVYGGGVSLIFGAYTFSSGDKFQGDITSSVSGDTVFSDVYSASTGNTFSSCSVKTQTSRNLRLGARNSLNDGSFGANAYGGAISVVIGPYCYASSSKSLGSNSSINGSVIQIDTELVIKNNVFVDCTANSVSSGGGGSNAANSYGGGVSLLVGAYSYSYTFDVNSHSTSSISGITAVYNTSYSIVNNSLIDCIALSETNRDSSSGFGSYGANVYGGGISIMVGAYSYSFGINEGSSCRSVVSGDTALSSMTYIFSSNSLSNCQASSNNSGGVSSDGANSYGGGLSFIVGAYSYSYNQGGVSSDSLVSGSSMVSVGNFTVIDNTLVNCSVLSSTSGGGFSAGSDGYGGGIALIVGAYCYKFGNVGGSGIGAVSGKTAVSNANYYMMRNLFKNCKAVSQNDANSIRASCFGGAVCLMYRPQVHPQTNDSITEAIVLSSRALVANSAFIHCMATTASESCASGSSNAAGGALYFRLPSVSVNISRSAFSNSSASVFCAAFSQTTLALGGGVSIFRADDIYVSSSDFVGCFAQGVPQGNNVFVSGGGVQVSDAKAFLFQNCVVRDSSIRDAFSSFLQSGGGALGTENVSIVNISRSQFYDNADSSLSGIVFLLQHRNEGMVATITNSVISTAPSRTPALNISCGTVCPKEQQMRTLVFFDNSYIIARESQPEAVFETSSIMTIPAFSSVDSKNSSLNCNFTGTSQLAVLSEQITGNIFLTCAPCQRSFEVASTSADLDLAKLYQVLSLGRQQCRSLESSSSQQCPYGVGYCSTIVNITVGFWTNFSSDGKLGNPSICPPKYCGCQNIARYKDRVCRLFPPLSPKFFVDDALCNYNRSGVLCGGCKPNFTQSLNGFSCVSNDDCLSNMGWTWALSVVGYIVYSGYIVFTSSTVSNGLIMCVLLYGQVSSFASIPSVVANNAKHSISSTWLSQITQFTSIASLYDNSCYSPNMGAYAATLARLIGPAVVFAASVLITVVCKPMLKRHAGFFIKRKLRINASYTATITNVLLLLFSSVTDVVFQLITCQDIGDDKKVVFIDGTVQCDGSAFVALVIVAIGLCTVPILFMVGLKFNKIPAKARSVACSPFVQVRQYWVAVSLMFRFSMTIISASYRQLPSVASMILAILTICMLMMLIAFRPYIYDRTFFMDIFCYTCLFIQFLLASLVRASESLGMSAGPSNNFFSTMNNAAEASIILR